MCLSRPPTAAVPVDLHIDEGLEPEPFTLGLLVDAVAATGFPHGVVASHCVSLGAMAAGRRARDRRPGGRGRDRRGVPAADQPLPAGPRRTPSPRPADSRRWRALRAAGVTVAAGGDNLQDPFNRLGRADPLETAGLLVAGRARHARRRRTPASAAAARRAMGLSEVDIRPGAAAELLAIRAGSIREAVAEADPNRVVIHAGPGRRAHRVDHDVPNLEVGVNGDNRRRC